MTAPVPAALLAAAVLLAAGYALGRIRPWDRLATWANWEVRFHLDRWATRPRQTALFVLLLMTDPIGTVRAWRHRHDPPAPRSAPARSQFLANQENDQ
ncbi:hypothetical protein ACWDTP_38270 [Mycobacterium sp. NPDC003449]